MKIAISGKGGVGKTTIAGSLSRLLGRRGYKVLAIDGDPNPNLGVVLGLPNSDPALISPKDLLEKVTNEEGQVTLRLGVSLDELLGREGTAAPDGVTLLMVGKPDHAGTGCMCGSHAVIREIVHAALSDPKQVTVLDMEASLEHMKRGTAKHVDTLFAVVEPYFRSLEAGRRIQELARELGIRRIAAIANKVRTPEDEEAVLDFCRRNELDVAAVIPFDETVMQAEREGRTLIDMNGTSPSLARISALADRLQEDARPQ